MPYMYILECADGSYYTGSTWNLEKRLAEHESGIGAKHTARRLPVKLVYCEECDRIDDAFYREKQVQGWSRKKKNALIAGDTNALHVLAECRNETHHGFDSAQPPFDSAQPPFDSAQPPFDSAQPPGSCPDPEQSKRVDPERSRRATQPPVTCNPAMIEAEKPTTTGSKKGRSLSEVKGWSLSEAEGNIVEKGLAHVLDLPREGVSK